MALCFISYARANNLDGRLARFVQKLEKELPGHLPHGTDPKDVVFFDALSIESGDEWMARLADAARRCKVCVCFYSLPFFTSRYSGREVQVFLERVKAWSHQAGAAGGQAVAIIPVIWLPHRPVPAVLAPFQWTNDRLPSAYTADGLHGLALRKGRADAYNTVLFELARKIAATVTSVELPEAPPIAAFDAISSAFHDAVTPTRYGASALILADAAARVRPFGGGGPSVHALIEDVAGRCALPFREAPVTADVGTEIAKSIAAREMPVLVIERASLASPLNGPLVTAVVSALDASATAVIFGPPNQSPADAVAEMRGLARQRLAPWSTGAGAEGCVAVVDAATFAEELEPRLRKVRDRLVAADPFARAENPALAAGAATHGVDVGTRPVLSATGGATLG